jgi:hypothetical protein
MAATSVRWGGHAVQTGAVGQNTFASLVGRHGIITESDARANSERYVLDWHEREVAEAPRIVAKYEKHSALSEPARSEAMWAEINAEDAARICTYCDLSADTHYAGLADGCPGSWV